MRASRLLALVLALQQRGPMTAGQLAVLLEVSRRTVLRDIAALNEAGVPVVTTQGAGGGVALLPGFRSVLAGVSRDEAAGLLLAGQPKLASALGLAAPAAAARAVLASALAPVAWREATDVERWFLHDIGDSAASGPAAAALRVSPGRLGRACVSGSSWATSRSAWSGPWVWSSRPAGGCSSMTRWTRAAAPQSLRSTRSARWFCWGPRAAVRPGSTSRSSGPPTAPRAPDPWSC